MDAELIIVAGSRLGDRFALNEAELIVGRDPECGIALDDAEAASSHCSIRGDAGGFRVVDHGGAHGTYVNGMRIDDRVLEDGDQISVGDTVLLFSLRAPQGAVPSTQTVLLRACSLQYLVRALLAPGGEEQRPVLEGQLLRLIGDLVPCTSGGVLAGGDEREIVAAAADTAFAVVAARAVSQGAEADSEGLRLAVPLYVRGRICAVLAAGFPATEAPRLAAHQETLAAIATLASSALDSAHEVERLRAENEILQERAARHSSLIGSSAAMRKLADMVAKVAPLDTSVLLLGESGTGKEVVARVLHRESARRDRPFVAINCAAITETLLESELFGHERGAFTGAVAQKKGKLEIAEGGTVFLDEIAELALPLQAKLLRVLQQREFERVGGTRTIRLNVRLIAATNRDLAAQARRGAFREDLYHRLNVVALRTPPLRERGDDVLLLARHFLERASERCRRRVISISPEAQRALIRYSWPGNVRELENAIERAVVLGDSQRIELDDLPETVTESAAAAAASAATGFAELIGEARRDAIVRAWSESGGDYKAAAARLGVHPNSLLRMIRKLGLREHLQE